MFRKPKAKNIRQRVRDSDDEETSTKISHNFSLNGVDSSNNVEETFEEDALSLAKPKSILSFDQNEGRLVISLVDFCKVFFALFNLDANSENI